MIIHCQNSYTWGRCGTLFVTPAGSVSIGGESVKKWVKWWLVNWLMLLLLSPVILFIYLGDKNDGNKTR